MLEGNEDESAFNDLSDLWDSFAPSSVCNVSHVRVTRLHVMLGAHVMHKGSDMNA